MLHKYFSLSRQRFCRAKGNVFVLNQKEREIGTFHLQYSSKRGQYERGDRNEGVITRLDGWEAGTYLHRNIAYKSATMPGEWENVSFVAWKFDFGAYVIDRGEIKCARNDAVQWRLSTRRGKDDPICMEWPGGSQQLSGTLQGASYLILTAIFPDHDPNTGPPTLLLDKSETCHIFKLHVHLKKRRFNNAGDDLSAAAMKNDLELMERLVGNEYDSHALNQLNSEGDTALHVAFQCRSNDAGMYLMKKCPELEHNLNVREEKPLQYANRRMQRLAKFGFVDAEAQLFENEKLPVGFDLQNDRDFTADAIDHEFYAKGLANALYSSQLQTPLTIGIFAPWGSGKTFLLKMLTNRLKKMNEEYHKRSAKKDTFWSNLILFLRILFYYPPSPILFEKTDVVDFVYVDFRAWEYAGSDNLWAGIVTKLVARVEFHAGYWKTRFFRIIVKPWEILTEAKREKDQDSPKLRKTRFFRYIWIPNFVLLALFILLIIAVIVSTINIATGAISFKRQSTTNSTSGDEDQGLWDFIIGMQAALSTVLGGALLVNAKQGWNIVTTFMYSQSDKIESMVNRPDMSSKLGFMADIKREVKIASGLINWMSNYKKRPIRIVITVDDLDRCPKQKAVQVVEALNILLSDEFAPFICIFAVDSRVIVEAIEESLGKLSKNAYLSGHEYLKKMLQLQFCIPTMTNKTKRKFLQKLEGDASTRIVEPQDNIKTSTQTQPSKKGSKWTRLASIKVRDSGGNNFFGVKNDCNSEEEEEGEDAYMKELIAVFKTKEMLDYVSGNPRNIKRLFNQLCVTANLVKVSGGPKFLPREMVMWTILLDQWPYRTIYMIHHIEDNLQRQELGMTFEDSSMKLKPSSTLKDVYTRAVKKRLKRDELDWKMMITLDGDPELFQRFLETEMKEFNVADVQQIIPYSVHLNRSIGFSIAHAEAIADIEKVCA
ncbi:NTPase KAP family P-loop domain-containing protein 1-like [Saccoglossus kowalevskii]